MPDKRKILKQELVLQFLHDNDMELEDVYECLRKIKSGECKESICSKCTK